VTIFNKFVVLYYLKMVQKYRIT